MSWVLLILLGTVLVTVQCEKYTDRYDNINIDEILANKRLFRSYINCVLDKGKCTTEGKELKTHIIDAMQSSCEKCTDFQRKNARRVVNHIRENETDAWESIKKKYDPDNKYKELYEAFLAADN